MANEFVVVWNELHSLMASLSRTTPLIPVFKGSVTKPTNGSAKVEDVIHDTTNLGSIVPQRYYEMLDIPEFWANGGRARTPETLYHHNYFDANRVDELCRDGLRNRISYRDTSMFSFDPINFGVGILRPVRAWSGGFYAALGEALGKLTARGMEVYGHIIARTHIDPEDTNICHAEDWESTNMLYGDMYGEVQQINDRREEKDFLEEVVRGLNGSNRFLGSIGTGQEYKKLYRNHLACQNLWQLPPQSPHELLERVDYILGHVTLDEKPTVDVKLHKAFYKGPYLGEE
jgi:hypothetical protein